MLKTNPVQDLRRVVVLNPKGGSGKTTLAFNLAGYLASTGRRVALVDMDRQGSSTRWLNNRASDLPQVRGVSALHCGLTDLHREPIDVPGDVDVAVIDAPAGLSGRDLIDYTCGAHAILVPVLPSDLDIHAASRLVSDLLLVAQVSRRNGRLGVVANRVRERTLAYRQLSRFLARLSIAVVGVLRDSQNYTWAAAKGLCIHDMPKARVGKDLEQWAAITDWLEARLAQPLNARDLLRPAAAGPAQRRRPAVPWLAAASIAVLAGAAWWGLQAPGGAPVSPPVPLAVSESPLPVAEALPAEPLPEPPPAVPVEKVREKWQLNGVAKVGKDSIVILRDRLDDSTLRVAAGGNVDGWIVSDTGADYAVLAQDGEKLRLELVTRDAR
ncbi:MAG: ParA family protein [Gammaproteobacteria bacterium]|nr:ParA family protein [Gammaproteobacteria bacterium]MDH4254131.1 ParA family protein [Gammaproteobacteria bacterium]MDH5309502.1 ParA family protein [Gammaproteobacteria bacterium]